MTAAELIAYLVIAIEIIVVYVPPLLIALAAIGLWVLIATHRAEQKGRMKNGCNCRFCKDRRKRQSPRR